MVKSCKPRDKSDGNHGIIDMRFLSFASNFGVEEKVREDTNLSGKSHTLLLFVERKISDEQILAAKATAWK